MAEAETGGVVAVIETEVRGGVGHITLNRPEALNSLNIEMIRGIGDALESWRENDDVTVVLVTSSSPRAFCAGGDIKVIRQSVLDGDVRSGKEYFAAEYQLNAEIAEYPKPYVALIEAAAFGGGLGISMHGSIRIVTENAVLAMPETAIGFVPDVGASYFLSRLPGHVGQYLGLTGVRLSATDALHLGLATHFVPSESAADMTEALLGGMSLETVIEKYTRKPLSEELSFDLGAVNAVFSAPTVEAMVDRLTCDSPWSRTVKTELSTLSPTSLVATRELIERGRSDTLRECLARELRMAAWIIAQPDFAEGVRAVLVDKDRSPAWNPLVLEMVQPEAFQAFL